jgi:PAS domain S-box-containing protein
LESIDNVSVNSADICSNFINILDTVFKDCPDGVVYKDNTLCYRMANSAFCKYYGIKDKQDYIGKRDMKFLSSENQKLIFDISHTILEEKRPLSFVMSLNNKSNVVLSVTSSPIYFEDVFLGIISIIKDITQEESLKEEFVNKHYEYINSERKLQAQRETFVASLGHDLKNPTIAQIRSLELLLKGSFGEISQEQGEIIEMVLDSCRYMNGMLSTLLATYRNQGGVVKLNFAEFSLPDLVNECVSEMIYVAKDKGVNITVVDNTSENIIQADRVQIKRVIMNLLSNGIKYAFSNTELNLQIYGIKNMIGFEFMNESPYIPEERRKSLFAQYVSYASAHNELGIGLGLYASKKIIDGHNGKIFVESYKNNRNSFGFRIPIVQKNNLSDKFIQF